MFRSTYYMLKGMAIGAGLMYFYDPQMGRRRRKMLGDKFTRCMHDFSEAADATWKDLTNRSYGVYARARSPLVSHDNSDDVVVQRVRSQMGRHVSHPHAIQVTCHNGEVTLTGPILAREVNELVSAVENVTGVKCVNNRLDVHESPGNISALQG